MLLSVMDRLTLLGMLPETGSFFTIKLVREAREALSFDEEENERLKFVQDDGRIQWAAEANIDKDIELGAVTESLILKRMEELDKEELLRVDVHFDLCAKFGYEGLPPDDDAGQDPDLRGRKWEE